MTDQAGQWHQITYSETGPNLALERLQDVITGMTLRLFEYCEARGLPLFLIGGTALGAVRDGRIIPWDDDIDVAMLREDYDRLIASLIADPLEGTFIQTWQTEPDYYLPFAKLRLSDSLIEDGEFDNSPLHRGIFVDVFPYDRLPASRRMQGLQRMLLGALNLVIMPYGLDAVIAPKATFPRMAKRAGLAIRKLVGARGFIRMREWIYRLPGVTKGDLYDSFGMLGISFYARKILRGEDLVPTRIEQFGRNSLPVPGNCERFLDLHYGAWQAPPPPGKRQPGHMRRVNFGPLQAPDQA